MSYILPIYFINLNYFLFISIIQIIYSNDFYFKENTNNNYYFKPNDIKQESGLNNYVIQNYKEKLKYVDFNLKYMSVFNININYLLNGSTLVCFYYKQNFKSTTIKNKQESIKAIDELYNEFLSIFKFYFNKKSDINQIIQKLKIFDLINASLINNINNENILSNKRYYNKDCLFYESDNNIYSLCLNNLVNIVEYNNRANKYVDLFYIGLKDLINDIIIKLDNILLLKSRKIVFFKVYEYLSFKSKYLINNNTHKDIVEDNLKNKTINENQKFINIKVRVYLHYIMCVNNCQELDNFNSASNFSIIIFDDSIYYRIKCKFLLENKIFIINDILNEKLQLLINNNKEYLTNSIIIHNEPTQKHLFNILNKRNIVNNNENKNKGQKLNIKNVDFKVNMLYNNLIYVFNYKILYCVDCLFLVEFKTGHIVIISYNTNNNVYYIVENIISNSLMCIKIVDITNNTQYKTHNTNTKYIIKTINKDQIFIIKEVNKVDIFNKIKNLDIKNYINNEYRYVLNLYNNIDNEDNNFKVEGNIYFLISIEFENMYYNNKKELISFSRYSKNNIIQYKYANISILKKEIYYNIEEVRNSMESNCSSNKNCKIAYFRKSNSYYLDLDTHNLLSLYYIELYFHKEEITEGTFKKSTYSSYLINNGLIVNSNNNKTIKINFNNLYVNYNKSKIEKNKIDKFKLTFDIYIDLKYNNNNNNNYSNKYSNNLILIAQLELKNNLTDNNKIDVLLTTIDNKLQKSTIVYHKFDYYDINNKNVDIELNIYDDYIFVSRYSNDYKLNSQVPTVFLISKLPYFIKNYYNNYDYIIMINMLYSYNIKINYINISDINAYSLFSLYMQSILCKKNIEYKTIVFKSNQKCENLNSNNELLINFLDNKKSENIDNLNLITFEKTNKCKYTLNFNYKNKSMNYNYIEQSNNYLSNIYVNEIKNKCYIYN